MRFGPSCILKMSAHTGARQHDDDHVLADSFELPTTQHNGEHNQIVAPTRSTSQRHRAFPQAVPPPINRSHASSDNLSKATRIYQKYAIALPTQHLPPYTHTHSPTRPSSPSSLRSWSSSSSLSLLRHTPSSSRPLSRTSSSTTVASASSSSWDDFDFDDVLEMPPYPPPAVLCMFLLFGLAFLVMTVVFGGIIVADVVEALCSCGGLKVWKVRESWDGSGTGRCG